MRIGILGTRGIPANYGGFETFAQELAPRLVARGHDVTVYCRAQYVDPAVREFKGVRLQQAPQTVAKNRVIVGDHDTYWLGSSIIVHTPLPAFAGH